MAPGDLTTGRRVDDLDEMEPGDYCLRGTESEGAAVWFVLPDAVSASPFAEPYNQLNGRVRIPVGGETGWTMTEDPDGAITLNPSIAIGSPVYWHGYLEHGTWREV